MARKKKRWTFRVGERGARVVVEERSPGGVLYARVWNAAAGKYERRSLGHNDRDRAEQWAVEEAQRLRAGQAPTARTTLARVLAEYQAVRSPTKCATEQRHDARRARLMATVFGGRTDPTTLTNPRPWEAYVAARRSGRVTASGESPKPGAKVRRPGDRVLEQDCEWFVWVLAWAQRRGLIHVAPNLKTLKETVTGWPEPRAPRRPYVTRDRFDALRAVAPEVMREERPTGRRIVRPSYLLTLLDLAYHTGRRISQIVALRYADYLPEYRDPATGAVAPALRWRAETDKQRTERVAPLNTHAHAAIQRLLKVRPGIGDAPMFPRADDPTRPISRHVADDWLKRAEKLADLPHLPGGGWHAFRRTWATARKHLSAVDVAAAGGWAGPHTLQTVYQQADVASMVHVVEHPAELVEAKQA